MRCRFARALFSLAWRRELGYLAKISTFPHRVRTWHERSELYVYWNSAYTAACLVNLLSVNTGAIILSVKKFNVSFCHDAYLWLRYCMRTYSKKMAIS